jgi:hypothetical protein
VFDSLGLSSRWDIAQLSLREGPWEPEVPVGRRQTQDPDLPAGELRRISEEYEISVESLEAILREVGRLGKA